MSDLFGNEKILALSWKEPFGSMMLHGKIETRTWGTNYRGLVLICCSQKAYSLQQVDAICGGERNAGRIVGKLGQFWKNTDTLGMAIGIGRLINSRRMIPTDEEKAYVAYYDDLYSHIYEYVRPLKPFPWKGSQGWKTVEQSIIDKIELL